MKDVQSIINAMTVEELDKSLLKRKEYRKEKYPIIKISGIEYRVTEWKENLYLEGKQKAITATSPSEDCGFYDNWYEVEDLTEMKVWEYNKLVESLNYHYPDYPIEYLESRFV